MLNDPSYPIGKYEPQPFSKEQKDKWLLAIKLLPEELERSIENLDAAQLQTPYRKGGWTVQQLVHHVADSHMNSYIRFKLGCSPPRAMSPWGRLTTPPTMATSHSASGSISGPIPLSCPGPRSSSHSRSPSTSAWSWNRSIERSKQGSHPTSPATPPGSSAAPPSTSQAKPNATSAGSPWSLTKKASNEPSTGTAR